MCVNTSKKGINTSWMAISGWPLALCRSWWNFWFWSHLLFLEGHHKIFSIYQLILTQGYSACHPSGALIDAIPGLQSTNLTVYCQAESRTQTKQLERKCSTCAPSWQKYYQNTLLIKWLSSVTDLCCFVLPATSFTPDLQENQKKTNQHWTMQEEPKEKTKWMKTLKGKRDGAGRKNRNGCNFLHFIAQSCTSVIWKINDHNYLPCCASLTCDILVCPWCPGSLLLDEMLSMQWGSQNWAQGEGVWKESVKFPHVFWAQGFWVELNERVRSTSKNILTKIVWRFHCL